MKELACHHFFLQPTTTLHRRYEALRAVFVDHRPMKEVAQHFGYTYGTLRNLAHEFRVQWEAQQVPPFSPNRAGGGQSSRHPACFLGAKSGGGPRTVSDWN